jgi:diguanylate cyclase (GGDEF)-like protein
MEHDERSGATLDPSRPGPVPRDGWRPGVFDILPVGVGIWAPDGFLEHANPVLCDLLDARLSELVGTELLDLVSLEERAHVSLAIGEVLDGVRNAVECRVLVAGPDRRRQGVDRSAQSLPWPVTMHVTGFYGADGGVAGLLGQVFDFSPADTGPPLPSGLARVLEEGSDFLLVIEAGGTISYGNRAARTALGVDAATSRPTVLDDVLEPDSLGFFREVVEPALAADGVWQGELSLRDRDGVPVPVSARFVAHGRRPDAPESTLSSAISVFARDITDLKNAERRLRQLATHDYLTGLPNRLLLYDRLELALNRYVRYGSPVALMFCDLDGFKPVNDRYGHAVGDAVLMEVADRIHSVVRDTDTAARVGGDEFAVLVEGVDDMDQLTAVADRLVTRVAEPVYVGGVTAAVGVSIGLAVASGACHEVDTLVALADSAMYRAKAAGRGRYVVVTDDDL